ncbi:MAG: HAD family phosphatase [Chloroflexi bacterium]|nr:HAD family phosphatase [Chloroflexota bacterium]
MGIGAFDLEQFTGNGRTNSNGHWRPAGVVVDLDGTLIDPQERISWRVLQTLRATARRIPVIIASGREPKDVVRFARIGGLRSPQVSDNGARIVDPCSGRTIEETALFEADCRRVLEILDRESVTFFAVEQERGIHHVSDILNWKVTVIAARARDERQGDLLCRSVLGMPMVSAVKSTSADGLQWFVNFTHSTVDKGAAIRRVAALTGIDPAGLVVIGDSYNDLSMFNVCGLSIAMGGAPADVRALAHLTVPSVTEDGLAEALETYVLPKLL